MSINSESMDIGASCTCACALPAGVVRAVAARAHTYQAHVILECRSVFGAGGRLISPSLANNQQHIGVATGILNVGGRKWFLPTQHMMMMVVCL